MSRFATKGRERAREALARAFATCMAMILVIALAPFCQVGQAAAYASADEDPMGETAANEVSTEGSATEDELSDGEAATVGAEADEFAMLFALEPSDDDESVAVAEASGSIASDGEKASPRLNDAPNAVCRIVSTGKEYSSLAEAVEAAKSGDTVEIIANSTVSMAITTKGKALTLRNAEGCNAVTSFEHGGSLQTSGSFTLGRCVLDGQSVARSSALVRVTGGAFCIDGAEVKNVKCDEEASKGGAFLLQSGTLDFKAGTISNCVAKSEGSDMKTENGGSAVFVAQGASFTLSGGVISACGSDEAGWYRCGAVCVQGTFVMTGGRICEGKGSHGNVFCAPSGTVELSGGSITGNSSFYDGGALFLAEDAKGKISGTVEITGNVAGRSGGAVGLRERAVLEMSGGVITGNNVVGDLENSNEGAVTGFKENHSGTIRISGSPKIVDNTYKGSEMANVAVYSPAKLEIGTLDEGALVGVYGHGNLGDDGKQFAVSQKGNSSTLANLRKLFNDKTTHLGGTPGTGKSIVWAGRPVCKIVEGGVVTPYASMNEAFTSLRGKKGKKVVEMIVRTYRTWEPVNVKVEPDQEIVLTTAKTLAEGCTDGYSYEGAEGVPCVVIRDFNDASMFSVVGNSGGTLTFANIALDGDKSSYVSNIRGGVAEVSKGASLRLAQGCTIRNSKSTERGGAVGLSDAGTTLLMEPGSLIDECETSNTFGGGVYQSKNTRFFATGGTISRCGVTESDGSAGGLYCASGCVTELGGKFEAFGNYAPVNGSFCLGGGSNARIKLSGAASIHDNSITGPSDDHQYHNGSALHVHGSSLEIEGEPVVRNNHQANSTEASPVCRNVYVRSPDSIKVVGNITGGEVGVYSENEYRKGDAFGKTYEGAGSSTLTDAHFVAGLNCLKNDRDPALSGMPAANSRIVWGVVGDATVQLSWSLPQPMGKDAWFVIEAKELGTGAVYRQPICVAAGAMRGQASIVVRSGVGYSFAAVSKALPWRQGNVTATYNGSESPLDGSSPQSVALVFSEGDGGGARELAFASSEARSSWLSDSASVANVLAP